MALTKITRGVIKANENYDTHNINSTGIVTAVTFTGNVTGVAATFTGDVSIGGTLTYQDVTNIDSVGIITARAGVKVPDSQTVFLGTDDDLRIFHDGSQNAINSYTSNPFNIISNGNTTIKTNNNDSMAVFKKDNAVELYFDNSLKLQTASGGVNIVGNLNLNSADSYEVRLGANNDLKLYHDGTDSWIDNTEGDLYLRTTGSGDDIIIRAKDDVLIQTQASEAAIIARGDGQVELYHDNSKKFETTSTGVSLSSGTDVRIELGTTGSAGTNNRNHLRGDGANMKYNCCSGGGHFFEANGGERLRIDSGGRVNIGDAHLSQTSSSFHVGRNAGGTAAGESVIAATLGNDSTMVSALLTVRNAGNRGNQGNNSGSPLAKFEFNNGTAFEIDKNGYRTLPYQPSAMAYNAQGQHMGGGSVAQFNSTRFNIGNMYNSSNGRMTVPVDGRYLVAYSGLHDYISQSAVGFDIRINGSNFNGGEGYQESNDISNSQLSKTLILHLSANDYVDIYIRQSGTQVHQRYGSFSVTLLT